MERIAKVRQLPHQRDLHDGDAHLGFFNWQADRGNSRFLSRNTEDDVSRAQGQIASVNISWSTFPTCSKRVEGHVETEPSSFFKRSS